MPSIDSRGSRGFFEARLNRQCRARLEYARPAQREDRYAGAQPVRLRLKLFFLLRGYWINWPRAGAAETAWDLA